MREMRTAHNDRKVLFLVSDGGDNHSRYSEHELRKALEEADLQIHAIGIHDGMAGMDEKRGPWIQENLQKRQAVNTTWLGISASFPQSQRG